jgi:hypothetical protein
MNERAPAGHDILTFRFSGRLGKEEKARQSSIFLFVLFTVLFSSTSSPCLYFSVPLNPLQHAPSSFELLFPIVPFSIRHRRAVIPTRTPGLCGVHLYLL